MVLDTDSYLNKMLILPWEEVEIYLIGPWMIKLEGRSLKFNALTCKAPVTNLVELIRIDKRQQGILEQNLNKLG